MAEGSSDIKAKGDLSEGMADCKITPHRAGPARHLR
jgi:hypothetical protein